MHWLTTFFFVLPDLQEQESYKAKFEALTEMIEPFKDQLDQYESEKQLLLSRNEETQSQVRIGSYLFGLFLVLEFSLINSIKFQV